MVSNDKIWVDKVRRGLKSVEKIEKFLEMGQKLQFSLKVLGGPWGTPGATQTPKNGIFPQQIGQKELSRSFSNFCLKFF